jgi:hypothetical protein
MENDKTEDKIKRLLKFASRSFVFKIDPDKLIEDVNKIGSQLTDDKLLGYLVEAENIALELKQRHK